MIPAERVRANFELLGLEPGTYDHEAGPTHYQLLGFRGIVDNPSAISAAADRLMSYVKERQEAQFAQEILNEVSLARITLLNPKRKAAYDRSISERPVQGQAPEVPTCREQPVQAQAPDIPVASKTSRTTARPEVPETPTSHGQQMSEASRKHDERTVPVAARIGKPPSRTTLQRRSGRPSLGGYAYDPQFSYQDYLRLRDSTQPATDATSELSRSERTLRFAGTALDCEAGFTMGDTDSLRHDVVRVNADVSGFDSLRCLRPGLRRTLTFTRFLLRTAGIPQLASYNSAG